MRGTFLRSLVVIGIVQFFITRKQAGDALEAGRAERMWALYPLNVAMNAMMWTLLIAGSGRALRALRRG